MRAALIGLLGLFLGLLALPGFGQQVDFRCETPPPSPQVTERATYSTVTCSDTLYVQVNVHFVQTNDSKGNFGRFDDGHPCRPDTAWTGYRYAQDLLYYANLDQAKNPPLQYNPNGQPRPPQQPKRVKWVLHGVYFDRNTTMREAYGQS